MSRPPVLMYIHGRTEKPGSVGGRWSVVGRRCFLCLVEIRGGDCAGGLK